MSTEAGTMFYLAGPMSGIPNFNYPQFFEAAASLRHQGYLVINPAEQDSPATMREVMSSEDGDLSKVNTPSWGEFLAHDVKLVADGVDAIALLPDWESSKGACTEVWVATLCEKPVYQLYRATLRYEPGRFDKPLQQEWKLTEVPIPKNVIAAKLMGKLLA